MQVPLRKTNINGGGLPNVVGGGGTVVGARGGIPPIASAGQTTFTRMGMNANEVAYPHHQHLMTSMARNNGGEGFTTTTTNAGNKSMHKSMGEGYNWCNYTSK